MDDSQREQIRHDWARHPDNLQFEGDAVDWWDIGTGRWRTTVIKEILLEPRFPRKRAVIYLPGEAGQMVEKVVPLRLLQPAVSAGSAQGAWFAFLPQLEAAELVAEQLAQGKEAAALAKAMGLPLENERGGLMGPDGELMPEEKVYEWIGNTRADGLALWADWKKVFEGGEEIEVMGMEFDPGLFGLEDKEL